MVYKINPPSTEELRRLALKRLGVETAQNDTSEHPISEEQARQLLEQVVISKIDVDIQNEYLQDTWTRLDLALSESRDLYDFAPIGCFSTDLQGTITKLNLTAANLVGQERNSLMGTDFAALFLPEQREGLQALMHRATRSGEDQQCEVTLQGSKVAARHLLLSLSRLPVGQGHHMVLTDISVLRQQLLDLRASEARWQAALHASGDGVWDWDVQSGLVDNSPRLAQLFGAPPEFMGQTMDAWRERVHPQDWVRLMAAFQRCLRGQLERFGNEHRSRCQDGSWKWVRCQGVVFARAPEGKVTRIVGICSDISHSKAREALWLHKGAVQQAALDALPQYLAVLDADGQVLQAHGLWQAAGLPARDTLVGCAYAQLLPSVTGGVQETQHAILAGVDDVLAGRATGFELDYAFAAGPELRSFVVQALPLHEGCARVLVSHQDVSRIRNTPPDTLRQVPCDELTGALSRRQFFRVAEREFARAARYNLPLMTLVIDINDFRRINDEQGMAVGDAVLKSFVQTCREVLRESDVIGRMGGDEFAVLLTNTTREGGDALVQRLLEVVAAPTLQVDGRAVPYSVSVGGSCLQNDDAFPDLFKRASAALLQSRKGGGNHVLIDATPGPPLW